jgi:hypothetical protein
MDGWTDEMDDEQMDRQTNVYHVIVIKLQKLPRFKNCVNFLNCFNSCTDAFNLYLNNRGLVSLEKHHMLT